MFGFAIIVSPMLRVAKGERYQLRITPILFKYSRITHITEKINTALTTITVMLLSFDLNKIRGRGTKKRVEVGVIAMHF